MHGRSVGKLVVSGEPDQQPVWAKIAALAKVVDDFNDAATAASSLPAHLSLPAASLSAKNELGLEVLRS
jgi:hypothetical protein